MTTWNYRIVKYADSSGFGLHEVYYKEGVAWAMTKNAISFTCDRDQSTDEITASLARALKDAKERPVFEEPAHWSSNGSLDLVEGTPVDESEGEPVANTEALNDMVTNDASTSLPHKVKAETGD